MTKKSNDIIIPKEQATFWLDNRGYWNNQHGKFERKRIIDFFHASIKKDKNGYYLEQIRGEFREKVYFPYEDTALFVFEVIANDNMILVLNNGQEIKLAPKQLMIKNDHLYITSGGETIKFTEKSMMAISHFIEDSDDGFYIRIKNKNYKIREI